MAIATVSPMAPLAPGNFDKHIGRTVRDLLFARGIHQKELAQHLGVDPTVVSKMIRGNRSWSIPELWTTAAILGVEVGDLLPPSFVRTLSEWAPRGSNPQPTDFRPRPAGWWRRRKHVLYAHPNNHPYLLGFPQPRQEATA